MTKYGETTIKRGDTGEIVQELRGILVKKSNAQIGWSGKNRKAPEPSDIAPTWIHYDVRCYQPQYLDDRFFCINIKTLDNL
jgi:hypothetical protein